MPPIYGGSRTRDSLREEEMAEAAFEQSDKWIASTRSPLAVGAMRISVRREPRGWVGVVVDMDVPGPTSPPCLHGREAWLGTTVYVDEMTALDEARRYVRQVYPEWTRDYERGFHTIHSDGDDL